MKLKAIFVGTLLPLTFVLNIYAQQDDFPVLKGPYLGHRPPGITPELFAPGIISREDTREFAITFSRDGSRNVFGYMCDGVYESNEIYVMNSDGMGAHGCVLKRMTVYRRQSLLSSLN